MGLLTDASIFAGDSVFGSISIEMTLMMISSAVRTGLHLSVSFSYALNSSTPGACNIEMQTAPSG